MKQAKRFFKLAAGFVVAIGLLSHSAGGAAEDPFPAYPSISANVAFWKKIYAEYTTTQGVMHDSKNLGVIYGVIDLAARGRPGAREINKGRIKTARHHYTSILNKLARGKVPETKEEKRVAALFGKKAKRETFRRAAGRIRCQFGIKDRFREGVIRSGAYLSRIKRIFRQYDLPTDLAYLPHVESSFDTGAYSKYGAAGIWQFTRSTGKLFLTIDYTVDERRDPIKSSVAAARLLKDNYKKLGDWPFAITAYNHGTNGMLRAKRAKGGYERVFKTYRSRLFRFASRNFYSEFLAAMEVAKNYPRYFGALKLHGPAKTREMVLPGYAPLDELAQALKVEVSVIRRLNPSLRPPVVRGEKYIPKGYGLRLPQDTVLNVAARGSDTLSALFRSSQKRGRFYRVRRGDTATGIAGRNGVSLRDLVKANGLNSRATIYVGQNLRLPPSKTDRKAAKVPAPAPPPPEKKLLAKKAASPAPSPSMENKAAAGESNRKTPPLEMKPPVKKTESQAPSPSIENKAAAGESNRKTPPPEMKPPAEKAASQAPSPSIENKAEAAKTETLPGEGPAVAAVDDSTVIADHFRIRKLTTHSGKPVGIIRVAVEETLGHYADWLSVPASRIRKINGLKYGKGIQIDQKIKIPLGKVTGEHFEEHRFEFHKEISEDFFNAYHIEQVRTYRIKKGDNIWKLCNDVFEIPVWLLKRYNANLDFNDIRAAQSIRVPVVEKKAMDMPLWMTRLRSPLLKS